MVREAKSAIQSSSELPKSTDRSVTPRQLAEDVPVERSLRPRRLAEYIGQERVKSTLQIFIDAAKQRGESLDHVLLYGPPGLGKTTLAAIIAVEMGVSLRITSGPAIERQGDLVSILTNLKAGDVLLSMRSTGSTAPLRKCCIPQWKTSQSTSSSAKGRRHGRCESTCPGSRWSEPQLVWH